MIATSLWTAGSRPSRNFFRAAGFGPWGSPTGWSVIIPAWTTPPPLKKSPKW